MTTTKRHKDIGRAALRMVLLIMMMVTGAKGAWAETIYPAVNMTYVDANNPTTSYGEISFGNTAKAGFNNVVNGIVGLANQGWNCNWITYLEVDFSTLPANTNIDGAWLRFNVSGSTDNKRNTEWGVGYNTTTWSPAMTYNTADRNVTLLDGTELVSTSKNSAVFNEIWLEITEAITATTATKKVTLVIFETAAAGGYIKNPSVSLDYTPIYNYSVKNDNGTTLKSGSDLRGASVNYTYPQYDKRKNTLYTIKNNDKSSGFPYFGKSFVLSSEDQTETVTYSDGTVDNVVYYSEAEEILGSTPYTSSNADIRCSDGKGAAFYSDAKMATLPAGAYKVWGQVWGNAGSTFSITVGQGGSTVWSKTTDGNLSSIMSDVFQLSATTDLYVSQAGDRNHVFDNVYVQAVLAFTSIERTVDISKGSQTVKPEILPDRSDVTFEIRSLGGKGGGEGKLASVVTSGDNIGEVTCKRNGTVVLRAKKTIDDTEYYTDHIIHITGQANATSSWTTNGNKETFTLTSEGTMPESVTNGSISMAVGNVYETQLVEKYEGEFALFAIDNNGYTHTYYPGGIPTMGSYYTFTPSENGTLSMKVFSNGTVLRLVDTDGNVLETKEVSANTWTADVTFNTFLAKNSTYYVYAESGTLYLNSFSFEKKDVVVINLVDQSLLLYPDQGSNYNRLDRSLIDGFDFACIGNSGARYKKGVLQLNNNKENTSSTATPESDYAAEPDNGCIVITPRIAESNLSHVKITSVTIYTSANTGDYKGTSTLSINNGVQTINVSSGTTQYSCTGLTDSKLTIKLTNKGSAQAYIVPLTSIVFSYTVDEGYELTKTKQSITLVAPDYLYGYSEQNVEADIHFDGQNAFYGDVNIAVNGDGFASATNNTLEKYLTDGKLTHITNQTANNPYQVTIGCGVGLLTVTYDGSTNFTPATTTTRLYSRDYVETSTLVLAAGEQYVVPAANGLSFALTATSADSPSPSRLVRRVDGTSAISLTGTEATTMDADGARHVTQATGDVITIKNNSSTAITLTKIEVYRKQATLSFSYSGTGGADSDVLFGNYSYSPNAYTITDGQGNNWGSYYQTTGTYTLETSLTGVAINASTGAITNAEDVKNGYIDVTLTVQPKEEYKAAYSPVSQTLHLRVANGMWDFRTYYRADGLNMEGSTGWSKQGAYSVLRDNENFEYILQSDGTPLTQTFALKSRYKHRLTWSQMYTPSGGNLHLFGAGVGANSAAYGHGGELMVPVKAGMLVEINAYSDSKRSEMHLEGVTALDGSAVSTFDVNEYPAESQYFLAKSDDYIVISNSSTNLDLHLCYIKVSTDVVFKYGTETYVNKGTTTFVNPILNPGTTTFSYTHANTLNEPATNIAASTGVVTLADQFGVYTVTTSGSGTGLLSGKNETYTVNVVDLTATDSSKPITATNKTDFTLTDLITIKGTDGNENTDLKSKVVFSMVNASPYVTLSGSNLTVEGVRSVEVCATLGAIGKTFICSVSGGSLNAENPVIAIDAESYTITLDGSVTNPKFNLQKMKSDALGDIKDAIGSLTFSSNDDEVSGTTLTISGFNNVKKGGVIPIYASYKLGDTTYDVEGTLTIAYKKHTWDFRSNLISGLSGWVPTSGTWNETTATIGQPVDGGTDNENYNWRMTRKISGKTNTSMIYYYNHPIDGQNALVIHQTEGLHLSSTPSEMQVGVELTSTVETGWSASYLMMRLGGRLVIPKLKKGQWIEIRWNRHKEDMAERIICQNLADFSGTPITGIYKIGNTFYNLDWSSSTYMFQAAADGDVAFEMADDIYINIQQIILHDPDWKPVSSIVTKLKGYDDNITPDDEWTGETAPDVKWQYVWDDQGNHTVTLLSKQFQNAPNAPQEWDFDIDETLTREGTTMTCTGLDDSEATLYYKGGWGKVKVTMTCYSQNLEYVVNKKSWTITFGQAPKQTYPYTWDFTKYFSTTESGIGTDSWQAGTDNSKVKTAIYPDYDTQNYTQSYFVEGAQLVSYALRNTNNGILPETNGLGFKLDTDDTPDGKPNTGALSLNMVSSAVASSGLTAANNNNATWQSGYLTIAAGGKIVVPKPGDNYDKFYIYIKSSSKPSSVSYATEVSGDTDLNSSNEQYKYHFTANANAEISFSAETNIYAIAVTDQFKDMTPFTGSDDKRTAWATESRDLIIDYTLSSLLTTNPVGAYAIIETASNPTYSADKQKTTVAIKDQLYVVPKEIGLIVKQTKSVPTLSGDATTYKVPLFVPAVTTATDATDLTYNLMRPAVEGKTFESETETFKGLNGEKAHSPFILTNKYYTWVKEGNNTADTDNVLHEASAPVFYRLHYFNDADKDKLGPNKAYLLLPTDKLNKALWDNTSDSGGNARRYVGIAGVSDMDEYDPATGEAPVIGDGRIYNLRGQVVGTGYGIDGENMEHYGESMGHEGENTSSRSQSKSSGIQNGNTRPLPPGIYIRNGRKIVIK